MLDHLVYSKYQSIALHLGAIVTLMSQIKNDDTAFNLYI